MAQTNVLLQVMRMIACQCNVPQSCTLQVYSLDAVSVKWCYTITVVHLHAPIMIETPRINCTTACFIAAAHIVL